MFFGFFCLGTSAKIPAIVDELCVLYLELAQALFNKRVAEVSRGVNGQLDCHCPDTCDFSFSAMNLLTLELMKLPDVRQGSSKQESKTQATERTTLIESIDWQGGLQLA